MCVLCMGSSNCSCFPIHKSTSIRSTSDHRRLDRLVTLQRRRRRLMGRRIYIRSCPAHSSITVLSYVCAFVLNLIDYLDARPLAMATRSCVHRSVTERYRMHFSRAGHRSPGALEVLLFAKYLSYRSIILPALHNIVIILIIIIIIIITKGWALDSRLQYGFAQFDAMTLTFDLLT